MPSRIQLSRKAGWRKPPGAVVVARPTRWGNPFIIGTHGERDACVEMFARMIRGDFSTGPGLPDLETQRAYVARLESEGNTLRGRSLCCWCRPGFPCHADALLAFLNPP